ncbi:MAG TPA: hypothetical protein VJU80_08645, partial [Solirubrobacteraceae bacterium]|nr:hypothetical protein [Solirubrobacteraceae bacterium]
TDNKGNPIPATPFDMGSGQVNPGPAFDPGLVYNSGIIDWLRYSCGRGVDIGLGDGKTSCGEFGAIPANQLNYPSIAAGALPGTQTITRTVTDVSSLPANRADHYTAHVTNPNGYDVTVSPSQFDIRGGQSVTYTVTITRTTAQLNQYRFGQLVWTDGSGHSVRSPISVQGVALSAPPTASGSGTSGTTPVTVTPGYTGTLTTSVQGLAQAVVTPSAPLVQDSGFNPNAPAASASVQRVDTVVPAGTAWARFATYDADYPAGTDLDVYVYRISGTSFVSRRVSGGSSAEEAVTIKNPTAGTYAMFVVAFNVIGSTVTAKPNTFVVANAAAGNLTATPTSQSVTLGTPTTVNLTWSGLASGRWLGNVNYGDGSTTIGSTLVSITSP